MVPGFVNVQAVVRIVTGLILVIELCDVGNVLLKHNLHMTFAGIVPPLGHLDTSATLKQLTRFLLLQQKKRLQFME